jgi:hypothetical protein
MWLPGVGAVALALIVATPAALSAKERAKELWIVTTRPIHAEEVINGADSLDHPFGVAHIRG